MSGHLTPAQALETARRIVALTRADQAEALVVSGSSALTRFAGNRIHQNVTETDTRVSVRAVLGTRIGVASTNRLDADSLRACSERAVAAARVTPEDPAFPGLPAGSEFLPPARRAEATAALGPAERARAALSLIEQSDRRGSTAAGKVEISDDVVAIANSSGVASAQAVAGVAANVLSTSDGGASGWASFVDADAALLAPEALGARAADLASRSEGSGDLEPGAYAVVLAPDAVATVLTFLGYVGFSAKAVAEGSSFMTGHLGERIMSTAVSVADDAAAPHALGAAFDFEGVPKRRTPLIDAGAPVGPVTDSYWAARTGTPNTGHALPAPNSFGPLALDLEMAPGDRSIDELVASVEHGIYVTRFHYVNVEEPVRVLLTGMTRDGTFLIEEGRLTRPLRNLRFTQSAIGALDGVSGVSRERTHAGERSMAPYVPALLIDSFAITGQTG